MLILAFDTSGFSGSIALLDASGRKDAARVVGERKLVTERRSAQTLAPAIDELLKECGVRAGELKLVAASVGPGSFTGLRVGVTTAKTLAYAVGAEVMGVSTLEAIAGGVPGELVAGGAREVQAVVDAQRAELFVGRFRAETSGGEEPRMKRIDADRIVPAEEWLAGLAAGVVVTGTGLKKLEGRLPAGVVAAPAEYWEPRAAVVGQIAWRDYVAGRRDDLWKLTPVYLRPSYAEEKSRVRGVERNAP